MSKYHRKYMSEKHKLFHFFSLDDARRRFGGSCFIKISFCKLPKETTIEEIFDHITHWSLDSIYIHGDDVNRFLEGYSMIFTNGVYHNLKQGKVDIYGINYYSPDCIRLIEGKLRQRCNKNDRILLEWLRNSDLYNGVYILGM